MEKIIQTAIKHGTTEPIGDNKADRQKDVDSFLAKKVPDAMIKRICATAWNVNEKTIDRDIKDLKAKNASALLTLNGKELSIFKGMGSVKTLVRSLIRLMLTAEGNIKTMRSKKLKDGFTDVLSYPSYTESLKADEKFTKEYKALLSKEEHNPHFRKALLLFERWQRRYRKQRMSKMYKECPENVQ